MPPLALQTQLTATIPPTATTTTAQQQKSHLLVGLVRALLARIRLPAVSEHLVVDLLLVVLVLAHPGREPLDLGLEGGRLLPEPLQVRGRLLQLGLSLVVLVVYLLELHL